MCDFLNLSGAEILKLNKDKVQKCVLDIKNNITWFNYQRFYFELLKADIKQLQDDIKKMKDGITLVTNQNISGSLSNDLQY